jgi:hypothetical protein
VRPAKLFTALLAAVVDVQIAKSPNHQITKSPNHERPRFYRRTVTRTTCAPRKSPVTALWGYTTMS